MIRLLPLVLVIVPFAPVLAQEPDSVAAHRYLPLDVGSHWQYERFEDECLNGHGCHTHFRGYRDRRVMGDSLINGIRYQLVRDMRFDSAEQHESTTVHLVRFDSTKARAFERLADGDHRPWPDIDDFACPLDLPSGVHTCDSGEMWTTTEVSTGFPSWAAGGTVQTPFKSFQGFICGLKFVADVGIEGWSCVHPGGPWDVLRFANVHGVEYGTYQPLTSEPPGEGPATAFDLYPNPTGGHVTVRFSLGKAQAAVLEVFDLLGRRVLERDLGTLAGGEHEVRLEIRRLPAGLYIVRLNGDAGAEATVQLTRMRE